MKTKFKTKVDGLPELQGAFKKAPIEARDGAIDALEASTRLILSRSQAKILKGPKTGRIYKRGATRHQASAPGEAPAFDTGKLAGSGEREITAVSETKAWGIVAFNAKYARWLEIGTRFIRPRPFLLPTLDELRDKIRLIFIKSIKARVERLGKK